ATELRRLLEVTPYARAEFERAYEPAEGDVEEARRLLIRSHMGFGSAGYLATYTTGFRSSSNRSGTTPARDWVNYPKLIPTFTARLRGVVIEQRDAVRVMQDHDTPETLHYVDPPYVRSERNSNRDVYAFDMDDDGQRELAQILRSLSGYVVLSGYGCPL